MAKITWKIKRYRPVSFDTNASSRKLSTLTSITKRYALSASPSPIPIKYNGEPKTTYKWFTVTNTGRDAIKNLRATVEYPFEIANDIPEIIFPNESFLLKAVYHPSVEDKQAFDNIDFWLDDRIILTVLIGVTWEVPELYYDGTIRHNGKYYYG